MPNQNNDSPEAVARFFRDHLLSFKDMMFESGKQRDSITAWLVGMSTGAIALIIAQSGKFSPTLYPTLKWSVGFLTGTIILGLLFRIFHLLLQEKERYDLISIASWLAIRGEETTVDPIELPEDASAEFIASCLYNHAGIDMTPEFMIDIRTNGNVEYWKNQYEEYTSLYHSWKEANDQVIERMIEDLWTRMANLEGQPPPTYEDSQHR